MAIAFNEYGFFDGVTKVDQVNWPKYMKPYQPDGVVAGIGGELKVIGTSGGMRVAVATGQCFVNSHFGILSSSLILPIENADTQYPRKDLIVARVIYQPAPGSTMVIDVKKGTPNSNPSAPGITQATGSIWEIPLAIVTVAANAQTISATAVEDTRLFSVLPVKRGGTGGKTAAEARVNLFQGGALPLSSGGTGASTAETARQNLGLKNAATQNTGSAVITYQFTGLAAGADVPGLPAEGLVFIEPAEESRAAFYAADVRYSGHIQNRLALKASSNPGTIKVIVGWIG